MWLAPFGCLYYFRSFLPSSGPFYPSSFPANAGIELTSKDHGSDCESLTFTTRPGSFPFPETLGTLICVVVWSPKHWTLICVVASLIKNEFADRSHLAQKLLLLRKKLLIIFNSFAIASPNLLQLLKLISKKEQHVVSVLVYLKQLSLFHISESKFTKLVNANL